jgi:hypothetical protein
MSLSKVPDTESFPNVRSNAPVTCDELTSDTVTLPLSALCISELQVALDVPKLASAYVVPPPMSYVPARSGPFSCHTVSCNATRLANAVPRDTLAHVRSLRFVSATTSPLPVVHACPPPSEGLAHALSVRPTARTEPTLNVVPLTEPWKLPAPTPPALVEHATRAPVDRTSREPTYRPTEPAKNVLWNHLTSNRLDCIESAS